MRRTRLLVVVVLLACSCRTGNQPNGPPSQNVNAIEVSFSPRGGCTETVVRELNRATTGIRIQAYSFTSAPIAEAIMGAHKRGVKVEALLDKSNRTDKYSAATFLKNQGCDVKIDARHAIAHNKIMIIDDKVILTGSFNFTKQAEEANAENLLVIRDNPDLAGKYVANFCLHQRHSEPYEGLTSASAIQEKPAPASQARFVGNQNGSVYHYAGCSAVKTIKPENLVEYATAPAGKRLHEGCPK